VPRTDVQSQRFFAAIKIRQRTTDFTDYTDQGCCSFGFVAGRTTQLAIDQDGATLSRTIRWGWCDTSRANLPNSGSFS
jgi:hypothetical protein